VVVSSRAVLTRGGVACIPLDDAKRLLGPGGGGHLRTNAMTIARLTMRDDGQLELVPREYSDDDRFWRPGDFVWSQFIAGVGDHNHPGVIIEAKAVECTPFEASYADDIQYVGRRDERGRWRHWFEAAEPMQHLDRSVLHMFRVANWRRQRAHLEHVQLVQKAELDGLIDGVELSTSTSTFARHFESLIRGDR
jgi:hypothetical protein